jgi:molybdopterin-dependent oxidoreductase alpha subunit
MSDSCSNDGDMGRFSPVPFGLGKAKPTHYREMLRIAWENRDNLRYAWRILKHGVCDGCSLGPRGLKDDVVKGVHLCVTRLNLLRLNTMPAMKPEAWQDIDRLRRLSNRELHTMGRLSHPLIRRRGEKGFTAVSWEEAYKTIVTSINATTPDRLGFFVTSRGITNETYYVAQKLARMLGTNNIDLCSRLCHAATVSGLKDTLGVAAPTCSLKDMIGTDLLVLFGTNLANNQPVAVKYMHYAKKAGTRIIVINPYREPGLERYWIPSITKSALFGSKIMDDFYQVTVGGDIAFMTGVLKELIDLKLVDRAFIDSHTSGFEAVKEHIDRYSYDELVRESGVAQERMEQFAREYGQARTAVFVYSMGLTQHRFGVDNVKALVNLVLARGMIGREKCGVMPIRGHSGVQGGGECGVDPAKFCGGFPINDENCRRFEQLWNTKRLPRQHGMRTMEMLQAAHERKLDVLYSIGGNLLHTMPDTRYMQEALERVRCRVHQDIVLNESALLDPGEVVVVLPAKTRYEQEGGGTSTSTERRIRFSPEVPGPRIGETKAEWWILSDLAAAAQPRLGQAFNYSDAQAIRDEMDIAMPMYEGIKDLRKEGDHFQWGGPFLLRDGVCSNMPEGRAAFTPVALPEQDVPDGQFRLMTRRGKQFNSMVQRPRDTVGNGLREDLFFNADDARELGLIEGARVRVRNDIGQLDGVCRIRRMTPRCIAAYWPEANVLISRRMDPVSGEPDYNANVIVEKL